MTFNNSEETQMRQLIVAYTETKIDHYKTKYEIHIKSPRFFAKAETKYDYFHISKSHPKFKQIFEAYSLSAPLVKYLEDVSVLSGSLQKPTVDSEVQPVPSNTPTQDNSSEVATDAQEAIADVPTIPDNYESMEWVELKSLASHFIQGRFNKQQALEALAEAKAKQ